MESPTTMEDINEGLSRVKCSVGAGDTEKYKTWMEEFGAV